ncbi:hypothetical protein [Laspinema olomoucense]|uniref:Uncharacterized protein n=1 Tax=Laspinema olomoucense D3b TaxID=2953688 RepID=A0ABT2N4E3_9CYAN|nr:MULTISPECIES: hypothetical protein [unclassified Laspinema]MCT7972324.1 hypothetical protein [Laspinema sp. D3d]MCT7977447.1 hypothetical protein [Laspinema sp. D3b]
MCSQDSNWVLKIKEPEMNQQSREYLAKLDQWIEMGKEDWINVTIAN